MSMPIIATASLLIVGGIFLVVQNNSDNDIPTSSNRENISIPEVKQNESNYKNKEIDSKHDFPPQIPASIINSKSSKQIEKSDSDFEEKAVETESSENKNDSEQTEEQAEQNQNRESSSQKILTDEEVEAEIQKAMAKYPMPPVPVDLVPYDERSKDSYRLPTEAESQNGIGDMPPVPPTMLINAK